ncbi:MAG: hypothetical protein ACJ788_07400, partial [Ktedonobacteraceae bacterium]
MAAINQALRVAEPIHDTPGISLQFIIGGGRDTSAPPIHDTPGILLQFIIGDGRDSSLIPCPPLTCPPDRVRVPGEGAAPTIVRSSLFIRIIGSLR